MAGPQKRKGNWGPSMPNEGVVTFLGAKKAAKVLVGGEQHLIFVFERSSWSQCEG